MNVHDATECAYKNGYKNGLSDGKAQAQAVLEKEIERKLVAMVKRRGGLCLKWTCPGWLGVPDRICLFPRGRVVFVETKRPAGGKRGAMQKWWARKLADLGFVHLWVKCEEDIRALELLIRSEEGSL